MTKDYHLLQNNVTLETWKEELSRAKKYKEAKLKRSEEKRAKRETETRKAGSDERQRTDD